MRDIPKKIRELVSKHKVIFSAKARRQLDVGNFDTDDLVHSILQGKVLKKQKDEQKCSQYKYTIVGPSYGGEVVYSCGKIVTLQEKSYFIITFHEAR